MPSPQQIPFVADGLSRLLNSQGFKQQKEDLLATIKAKYGERLAQADDAERKKLMQQIKVEYQAELKQLKPSGQALF